jgi:hypothetical protein
MDDDLMVDNDLQKVKLCGQMTENTVKLQNAYRELSKVQSERWP